MFKAWPKTPRLENEKYIVTEKIDGTNACVVILPDKRCKDGFKVFAQSRTKIITPGKTTDNFGFVQWVEDNRQDLLRLGIGRHYGEWWGRGIQRSYGLKTREFSLFRLNYPDRPDCCNTVPYLGEIVGGLNISAVQAIIHNIMKNESVAMPGFKNPEGVILQSCIYPNVRYKYIINK